MTGHLETDRVLKLFKLQQQNQQLSYSSTEWVHILGTTITAVCLSDCLSVSLSLSLLRLFYGDLPGEPGLAGVH